VKQPEDSGVGSDEGMMGGGRGRGGGEFAGYERDGVRMCHRTRDQIISGDE